MPNDQPTVLVISETHGLLPFAWRLLVDGVADLSWMVERDRYDLAWGGKLADRRLDTFDHQLGKEKRRNHTFAKALRESVEERETYVLTDSKRWAETFAGYSRLFASLSPRPHGKLTTEALSLGAWFDGEGFSGRHIVVPDRGLWPQGLGPTLQGGLTLIRPQGWLDAFEEPLVAVADDLKSHGFRGLVQVNEDAEGPVYRAGWPSLHTHAFVAELGDEGTPSFARVLEGYEAQFAHRFTTVLPVTMPPWPFLPRKRGDKAKPTSIPQEISATGKVFWHDFQTAEGGGLETAGLDGFVGVVRGSGDSVYGAREKALRLAQALAMVLPEAQWRPDAGKSVERVVAQLEAKGVGV